MKFQSLLRIGTTLGSLSKSQIRRLRKLQRRKQKKLNAKLKKRLFGHIIIAPCYYCKDVFLVQDLTVEHLKALCLGGTNSSDNIALACAPCNHNRGKIAWDQKQKENKKFYEQYFAQYPKQNRKRTL